MACVTAITAAPAPASGHLPWPAPPHHRSACDLRAAPALCRLHWWVHHTWHLQRARHIPRTRYWFQAERHPEQAPYLARRIAWRERAHRVSLIPIPPWPPGWLADALCVHHHEGAWNADTGNGYYGGMQFDIGTWDGNGGRRYAARADLARPRQQLLVALTTWRRRGWQPWPNTAMQCGLL